ncbi:hypothetical protein OG239_27555 [Streptomyces sp. NBC_00868]|uniref:hypothetical protein n=1 Tax=unclassified Streptomyces TaxID=2593676 RepID=UPI003248FFCA|nr:hypothetical protein OG239_27555 [Streptomyces sp. NBC_00868]
MSDEDETRYAHHDSLLGLLQRGRGLGAVRARQDPAAAAPLVYDVIRRDWRWDGVDDRGLFHARLLRDLELSPGPVVAQLAGDEDACMRAIDALELLALGGSDEAREGLRAHVREGAYWIRVLESVADRWPVAWWEDLEGAARSRIGEEADEEALPWPCEPWIRFGIRTRVFPALPAEALGDRSGEELLAVLADARSGDGPKTGVLRELARRTPDEALIPLVPSLGTSDGRRSLPALRRAVEGLGALAVPAARRWAADEREWLARLGADVLADHLGPELIPGLAAELRDQWRERAWCGPDRTAKRLARFGPDAAEAVPELRRFWLHTPHSWERPAYLEALAAIDQDGLDYAHTESLWDCEEQARLLGIARAPDLPEVRERLAALRDDPMEEAEVRAAAGARLEEARSHF